MQPTLNTQFLAAMLKNKRGEKGLRMIAEEIGKVSAATLSRIEQGSVPDVDTFIRICQWLQVPAETFIVDSTEVNALSIKEQVVANLRADKNLDEGTLNFLIRMIDTAYKSK